MASACRLGGRWADPLQPRLLRVLFAQRLGWQGNPEAQSPLTPEAVALELPQPAQRRELIELLVALEMVCWPIPAALQASVQAADSLSGRWSTFTPIGVSACPGEVGGGNEALAHHDWVHVVAGDDTTPIGALEVTAFMAAASLSPGTMPAFLGAVSIYETGLLRSVVVGRAIARGPRCRVAPLLELECFDLVAEPLAAAPRRLGSGGLSRGVMGGVAGAAQLKDWQIQAGIGAICVEQCGRLRPMARDRDPCRLAHRSRLEQRLAAHGRRGG